jgi:hypothetical protein
MQAKAQELDADLVDAAPVLSWAVAREEDAYWRQNFWQQHDRRADRDYEDYAPAYCVGYTGCAQYGGDYDDARRSLHANWERIKSDSRLSPDEAMHAIKAAWDRMALSPNGRAPRSPATSMLA